MRTAAFRGQITRRDGESAASGQEGAAEAPVADWKWRGVAEDCGWPEASGRSAGRGRCRDGFGDLARLRPKTQHEAEDLELLHRCIHPGRLACRAAGGGPGLPGGVRWTLRGAARRKKARADEQPAIQHGPAGVRLRGHDAAAAVRLRLRIAMADRSLRLGASSFNSEGD
uniref:Uncharacterized protein n=1 Tax=Macrostomum lignano TaxID=282301 RepID=A0A1I8IWM0_9PLAT